VVIEERSGTPLSQATAASRLKAAGITASSTGGCTTKSNPKCTSYSGLLSGTVNGAITLKGACDCTVVITGGTEVGHSTSGTKRHDNGFKLDFKKNTKLNNYIKNSFTKIANRGDGFPQWRSAAGNTYVVSRFWKGWEKLLNCFIGRGQSLGCVSILHYAVWTGADDLHSTYI
jgi:hypothetical protein